MTDIFLSMLEITVVSSVIILAVFIFRALFAKRIKPGVIGLLWALVLLRLCLPFTLESPVHVAQLVPQIQEAVQQPVQQPAGNEQTNSIAPVVDNEPETAYVPETGYEYISQTDPYVPAVNAQPVVNNIKIDWLEIAAYIWAAGAAAMLLTAVWKGASYGRRVKQCEEHEQAADIAYDIRTAMNITRNIPVRICKDISAPVLYGFFRAQILLPESCRSVDTDTLRCILTHELCHVKRRDILKGYIWLIAKAAHWFNPFVWLAYVTCKDDIELGCDDMVLWYLGADSRFTYTQSLIDVFRSYRHALPAAVPLFESKPKLTERVTRMLKPHKRSKAAAALSVMLALVMLVAGFTTACSPAAQTSEVTDLPSQTMTEQPTTEPTVQPEPTPAATPAKPVYEVIDAWTDSLEQDTLQVNIEADIVAPNIESFPTFEADPKAAFSQEDTDKFIKTFFGDAQIFKAEAPTAADVTLKLQIAEDTLFAMELGYFDFPDDWDQTRKDAELEKAREYRDTLKDQLHSAPEEPQLVPYDSKLVSDEQGVALIICYADLGGAEPAKLWIRNSNDGSTIHFRNNGWYHVQFPNKVLAAPVGDLAISKEDAKLKADELLKNMGLDDFECRTSYIVGKSNKKDYTMIDGVYAHAFVYTRNVAGMAAAPNVRANINADEKTSFKLSGYEPETIYITVNDKGICDFEWENVCLQGDMIEQNAKLMPFDKISGLIGQKICKQYEGMGDTLSNEIGHGDNWWKTEKYIINVDKVVLEYARMPQNGDFDTQVLVPVWNVYALKEWQFWELKDGEKYLDSVKEPISQCILTVNALDGSIIGES